MNKQTQKTYKSVVNCRDVDSNDIRTAEIWVTAYNKKEAKEIITRFMKTFPEGQPLEIPDHYIDEFLNGDAGQREIVNIFNFEEHELVIYM